MSESDTGETDRGDGVETDGGEETGSSVAPQTLNGMNEGGQRAGCFKISWPMVLTSPGFTTDLEVVRAAQLLPGASVTYVHFPVKRAGDSEDVDRGDAPVTDGGSDHPVPQFAPVAPDRRWMDWEPAGEEADSERKTRTQNICRGQRTRAVPVLRDDLRREVERLAAKSATAVTVVTSKSGGVALAPLCSWYTSNSEREQKTHASDLGVGVGSVHLVKRVVVEPQSDAAVTQVPLDVLEEVLGQLTAEWVWVLAERSREARPLIVAESAGDRDIDTDETRGSWVIQPVSWDSGRDLDRDGAAATDGGGVACADCGLSASSPRQLRDDRSAHRRSVHRALAAILEDDRGNGPVQTRAAVVARRTEALDGVVSLSSNRVGRLLAALSGEDDVQWYPDMAASQVYDIGVERRHTRPNLYTVSERRDGGATAAEENGGGV